MSILEYHCHGLNIQNINLEIPYTNIDILQYKYENISLKTTFLKNPL